MPVYLPPVSRRRFLGGSLAAASALALGKGLLAADAPAAAADPHRFALLSDTHVAADRAAVLRGVTMAEHLRKAVAEVAALSPRPAASIVNGDLALGTGESGDYVTLLELLAPLREAGVPAHLALGNHDHRDRFRNALPERDRPGADAGFNERQVYAVESPRADWFVLDSLVDTNAVPGTLGDAQLKWLAARLDARPNQPAIVVVHHNPDPEDPTRGGLTDTHALLDLLDRKKNAKALVFGHSHAWSVKRQDNGLYWVNLPAVAYVFQSAMPSGWVDVKLAQDGATLELRCIDPAHKQHGETHKLEWHR
jgi:3',5'-cyclic-AMP phosphodiesterase